MRGGVLAPLQGEVLLLLLAGCAVDRCFSVTLRAAEVPVVSESLKSFGATLAQRSKETRGDVNRSNQQVPSKETYGDILMMQARKEESYKFPTRFHHVIRGPRPNFQMKFPRSWVERVAKLRRNDRSIRFNFIGGMNRNAAQKTRRQWVLDFVNDSFTQVDYLRISDDPIEGAPRGQWDHTFRTPARRTVYDHDFDPSFWEVLGNSRFTLCPAGDNWWSFRFLEAILAGSIPIVRSAEEAMGPEGRAMADRVPFKYYIFSNDTSFEYVYQPDWADENLYWFVHYFTFIHGDNPIFQCPDDVHPNVGEEVLIRMKG